MDECEEGTPRSSRERSGVCFGGFRPPKQVEEPRVLARGAPLPGLGGEGMGSPKAWHRTIGARLLCFVGGIFPLLHYSNIPKKELALYAMGYALCALR